MMDYEEAKPLFDKNIADFKSKYHREPSPFEKSHMIPEWASESAAITFMVSAMIS